MIDILMSTYNGGRFLRPQIDSILGQSFEEFNLIIRDDGSDDDTPAILREYAAADPRVFLTSDNLGNLGARRSFMRLVELSRSPYFMLADQDDVWLPEKISRSSDRILAMSELHGDAVPLIVFTDLTVVSECLEPIESSLWNYQKLDPQWCRDWKKLLAQNVVTGCTIIGNRAAASAALPFALPEMMHDHWLAVNTAKYGRIEFLAEQTVLYRQHRDNLEGGKNFNIVHAMRKLPEFLDLTFFYSRAAKHFGGVSVFSLLTKKIGTNLRRLTKSGK